jgi:urease accessory protein
LNAGAAVLELLLADGRTPGGGYAHSGGLESALAGGLDAAAVPAFMRARLYTVGRCNAGLAAAAVGTDDLAALLELDREAAARSPVAAVRAADRRLGAGLLRTAAALWPSDALLGAYRASSALTPRAVALGAVARAAGLGALSAARLSLYDDASGVAAAAVKLTALDTAQATCWIAALAGEIEALAAAAARGGPLPSCATPLLDQLALAHSTRDGRLFAS